MSERKPTPEALAMVAFLRDRLRDQVIWASPDDPRPAARAGRYQALIDSWLAGEDRNPEPEVEVQAWSRGFQDGVLLALMVEASVYDQHPGWREEWAR